jgi:S1-C subfamily serine protease
MAKELGGLSDALAAAVKSAAQSVVRVEGRRRLPASGIVWSADGIIVTAHHVVERDESIGIGLPDGRVVAATLIGRDPATDMAVLRAEAGGLTAIAWADDQPQVGQLVMAVARPGEGVEATLGVISSLGEGWRPPIWRPGGPPRRHEHHHGPMGWGGRGWGPPMPPMPFRPGNFLRTDLIMYPGFSGGPLIDASGKALGMNTSGFPMRGMGLAVPAATVQRVVTALLSGGRVQRGYLGVGVQPVRLPAPIRDQLAQETGVIIVSVEPDSPAERAGLMVGDIIVSLQGQPVRDVDELLILLSSDQLPAEAALQIVRGGQVQEVTVITVPRA